LKGGNTVAEFGQQIFRFEVGNVGAGGAALLSVSGLNEQQRRQRERKQEFRFHQKKYLIWKNNSKR
jgi:hypothetical protein